MKNVFSQAVSTAPLRLPRATSAFVLFSLALTGAAAQAASVTLDTTYNTTGKTTTALSAGEDIGRAMIVDSNGKIVIAGTGSYAKSGGGYLGGQNFQIERRNADGSSDGTYNYDFDADDAELAFLQKPTNDALSALIQAPDGNYILGGSTSDPQDNRGMDFGLMLVDQSGALVNKTALNFNANGEGITALGNQDIEGTHYIVAAGNMLSAPTTEAGDFALARFDSSLNVDTAFGPNGDGKNTLDFFGYNDQISALLVMPDGKIVVGGLAGDSILVGGNPTKINYWALARFNADGSIDTSFGSNGDGKVTLDFAGGNEGIRALALQNGKIVAGGYGAGQFGVARFSADGILDTSFGTGGKTSFNFESSGDSLNALAINPSGILALGSEFHPNSGAPGDRDNTNFAIAVLTPDGLLDTTVPVGGKIFNDHGGANWSDGILAGAIDGNGKLVVAGFTSTADDPNTYDFASQRYILDLGDVAKPVVTVTSPAINQKLLYSQLTGDIISGTATDNVGITDVRVRLSRKRGGQNYYWNGTDFVLPISRVFATVTGTTNATWTIASQLPPLNKLDTGLYQVDAYATDAAGNTSDHVIRPFTLSQEYSAPTIALTTPAVNQKILIGDFNGNTISGTATDDTGVASVEVRLARKRNNVFEYWNGTDFTTTSATVAANITGTTNATWVLGTNAPPAAKLDAGVYQVSAKAYDAAGNIGTTTVRNFTLGTDFSAPTVAITSPDSSQPMLIADVNGNTIRGTASDDIEVTMVKVRLQRRRNNVNEYWNGTDFVTSVATVSATLTNGGTTWNLGANTPPAAKLDAGSYRVTAYATDDAGNQGSSAPRDFTLGTDFTAPGVTITTPSQNQVLLLTQFVAGSVNGSATDNVAVADVKAKLYRVRGGVTQTWDGTSFSTTPGTLTLPATLTGTGTSVTWSFDTQFPSQADLDTGTYAVVAYATDTSGRTKVSTIRNFTLTAAPADPSVSAASSAGRS